MKPVKFLAQFQGDLFPRRSAVGQEIEAILLTAPAQVSMDLAETQVRRAATETRGTQRPLPMTVARRTWKRRLGA